MRKSKSNYKPKMLIILLFIFLSINSISMLNAQTKSLRSTSIIDWESAVIDSTLSLDIESAGIQLPTGRNYILQILQVETPSLLKDTFLSLTIDSQETLGLSVTRKNIKLEDLNKVIDTGKRTALYFSKDFGMVYSEHQAILSEIGTLFITHKNTHTPPVPLETIASRPYTGIIIDAQEILPVHGEYTETLIEPCLFPKIWSEHMELVYEKNIVYPEIARNRGIITYSAELNINSYRDIVGNDPLRISAKKIFGINKTDAIISHNDYLRIMTVPENRALLQEGKVVIICPAEQLKKRYVGPIKDDNYYFVWQELTDELSRKPIKKVDFSDSWTGLRLTMYDVRFIADSDKLLPEETGRLDSIAHALLLTGDKTSFLIEGHTAEVGKPHGEQELSIQRAARIAEELILRGIPKEKIQWTGYGGTRPVGSNDTEEGRSMNRRVEIMINTDSTDFN